MYELMGRDHWWNDNASVTEVSCLEEKLSLYHFAHVDWLGIEPDSDNIKIIF
jgi:hypothetical protein